MSDLERNQEISQSEEDIEDSVAPGTSDDDDGPFVSAASSVDVTVEGSDDVNSGQDGNESNVVRRKRVGKQKKAAIIDSDSEDEENELESRALSPRTRMSITGIRPADLTDDSSDIGYSDDGSPAERKIRQQISNISEVFSTADDDTSKNVSLKSAADRGSAIHTMSDQSALDKSHVLSSTMDRSDSNVERSEVGESFVEEKEISIKSIVHQSPQLSSDDDVGKENISNFINSTSESQQYNLMSNLVQSKISAALTKVQPLVNKTLKTPHTKANPKYVSQDYYDKEMHKLDKLKSESTIAENLLEKFTKTLPDGGRQLSMRVERLKGDVDIKSRYLASLLIEDAPGASGSTFPSDDKDSPSQNLESILKDRKATFNNQAPDWDELSAAVNQIQPTHTGRQGMATFNTQKVLTVDRLKDLHVSLESCPPENVLADDPEGLKVPLMDHQKHALAWMAWRERQNPRGGILADDMGLGKTLTMISLALACKNLPEEDDDADKHKEDSESDNDDEETGPTKWSSKGRRGYYHGGTLVVCPASLMRQWEAEVQTRISRHRLTVCVHHGNNRETKPKHLRTYDIVVTTYNIVTRENKSGGALFGLQWKRIILDEAHVVRNHKAQSSVAVCQLKGKRRWALTGTPIQNKQMDVYALLKFLRCSPFDDFAHWKKWIDKSAGGQQRLNTIMNSLMLRRTKIQLQERGELQSLPNKKIEIIEVELDTDEMNVYQKIMIYSRTLFAQFLFQRAERNTDLMYTEQSARPTYMQTKDPNGAYYTMHQKFTKLHQGTKEVKSHEILVLLLRLRQICCHPGLIDAMLEDEDTSHIDTEGDESQPHIDLLEQLNKLAINDKNEGDSSMGDADQVIARASARVLQRSNPVFNMNRPSTKMMKVLKTLKERVIAAGDKAIVVSQWTSVLDILKTHIEREGVATLSLNGSIPVKNRQVIVTEFNKASSSKRILLLSLTAGGVGLNLVGANHLLLIDLHWNPQLEAQAQDRIYRVGQKKDVVIYKFMCKETIEERIKALQDQKLALADGVLTGAATAAGSKLSMDDLRGLFGL